MMPNAKTKNAKRPAIGFSAVAAWVELSISVTPWACSVAAVVMMIASPTRLDSAMPA